MLNSKKLLNSYMITAVLFIAAGIILISWPQTTMKIVCYGLGSLIFLYGAFQIYSYLKGRAEDFVFQMNLLLGLIACGIGLFMLMKSEIVISILPFIIGFTLLLASIMKCKQALDLKKAGYDGYKIIALLGAVTLVFAVLLMYNPFDAAASMVMFIGICLVFDGISELWTVYCIRKHIQEAEENIFDVTDNE